MNLQKKSADVVKWLAVHNVGQRIVGNVDRRRVYYLNINNVIKKDISTITTAATGTTTITTTTTTTTRTTTTSTTTTINFRG